MPPSRQDMFMHARRMYNRQKTQGLGNMPGPGSQRNLAQRVGNMNQGPPGKQTPPIIQRDPLNDYQGHNLPIAPGEHPPGAPLPDGNPSGNPDPRPRGDATTLGMRRLGTLGDKNRANDKTGLEVAMRLLGRAQAGKNFGGKAFGQRMGSDTGDFFNVMRDYLKGTGYTRMFRQAAGMPVRPKTKNYPGKPRGPQGTPGPYIPRDNNTHYVR